MHPRLVALVALLVVATTSRARAASSPDDPSWMHRASAFATTLSRHLPRYEVSFEAEDTDIETTISFTLLDHAPDWRRARAVLRRLVRVGR